MSQSFNMSFAQMVANKKKFHPAPNAAREPELSLLEKQALVDEMMRGMPMRWFECYTQETPNGREIFVTKGWNRLCALFEFADDQFPTWDQAAMKRWERGERE